MATLQVATERDPLLKMPLCQEECAIREEDGPKPLVCSHQEPRIVDALRQAEKLLSKLARGV
jgi:hypothetical protein